MSIRMAILHIRSNSINWLEVADAEISARFAKVAVENNTSAEEVLSSFIKDYIVSGGHPEAVVNKWPWSRQK